MKNDFKETYYRIYKENKIFNIEKHHHKRSINIFMLFGIIILACLVFPTTLLITLPLFVIYVIFSSKKQLNEEQECKKLYKERFIIPLLKEMFEDIQYNINEGLALDKYLEAEYADLYVDVKEIKKYCSNDHIILPIEVDEKNIVNIDIHDVCLTKDGDENDITIFQGLTGTMELSKNIQDKIKLNMNGINLNCIDLPDKTDYLSTELSEFNKYFSIIADNQILAMRIFTSDIVVKILDIFTQHRCVFDISIINNKLYIRISRFSPLELTIVLGNEKHKPLEKDFIALEIMRELAAIIYKIIDNTEI